MKLIVLLAIVSCLFLVDASLTENEKVAILEMHNNFRRKVANGEVNNQPSASNMKEMVNLFLISIIMYDDY